MGNIDKSGENVNKVILIYTGQSDMDFALAKKRDYWVKREPQIGFAYLSAMLKTINVDAIILDWTLHAYNDNELIYCIVDADPLFVGFYAASALKNNVIRYVKLLRKQFPDLSIFVGGPDLYDCESYLNIGADAYCLGEGDKTIIELAEHCMGLRTLESIKGIAYKTNIVNYTPPRELIDNLDALPIPDWDKYDLTQYFNYHIFDMQTPYASIMASRGCPFRCSYCLSHKIWGGKIRRRSVGNVMAEIDYLVNTQKIRYIYFQDDVFGWQSESWVTQLCYALIHRNYDLKWACVLHPMSFMSSKKEIIPLFKKAGCSFITMGLQTANKQILKNVNRGPKEPELLSQLVATIHNSDILNSVDFIFGLPGETDETMEETLQYALNNKFTWCSFYHLAILPGANVKNNIDNIKLSTEYIIKRTQEISRKYFLNPKTLTRLISTILRKNPYWFIRMAKHTKYIRQIAGI